MSRMTSQVTKTAAPSQAAGVPGAAAGQRGLVQRARGQVEAHAQRDDGQADAPVVEVSPNTRSIAHGPSSSTERDRAGEAGDREDRDPDRAREGRGALGRLRPAEVGQQRGLHGLEELQRRAGDEQRVEHDPGQRGRPRSPTVSTAALRIVCSAAGSPAPRRRSRRRRAGSGRPRPRRRAAARAACRASAHGRPRSDASGARGDPERDRGLPLRSPTATATGKQKRETDSNSTSPP